MAEVIDLKGRQKIKKDLSRTEKLEALRTLLQCGRCSRRCAKCGHQSLESTLVTHYAPQVSFQLCPACLEEYQDLVAYLKTERNRNAPSWYNREWVRLWLAWIDYQTALSNYLTSPEVLEIIQELRKE